MVAVATLALAAPGWAAAQDEPAVATIMEQTRAQPGGLTSDEAARRAVDTGPGVRRARASRREAQQAAAQARAAFAPNVTLSASYTRLSEVDLPPFEIPGIPPTENPFPQVLNVFLFRATAAIPVTDYFLTILPAYEGTEGFADAADAQADVQLQQTAFRGREAYYGYVRALNGTVITELAVTTLEATLQDIEALVEAGLRPRADLLQMRARLASARASSTQARGALRLSERVLRTRIHLPAEEALSVGESLIRMPSEAMEPEEAMLAEALAQRPEARALRSIVRARQSMVQAQEGALYPRVLLTGQAEVANPNQRIFPQSEAFNATWALGVALSWSPTQLAGQLNQTEQANSQLEQAREDLVALEDGIGIEVTQVLIQYESARESIVSARDALIAADAAFNDRRRLLAAGRGTTTELAGAQLELTQAQLLFVDSYVLLHLALANRDRVVGRAHAAP